MRTSDYTLDVNDTAKLQRWSTNHPEPDLTPTAHRALATWLRRNPDADESTIAMAAWMFQREDLERQLEKHKAHRPGLVAWAHRTRKHYVAEVAKRMGIARGTASDDADDYVKRQKLDWFAELLEGWRPGDDYLVTVGKFNTFEVTLGFTATDDSPQPTASALNAASSLLNRFNDRKLPVGAADETDEELIVYLARGGTLVVHASPIITGPDAPAWVQTARNAAEEAADLPPL